MLHSGMEPEFGVGAVELVAALNFTLKPLSLMNHPQVLALPGVSLEIFPAELATERPSQVKVHTLEMSGEAPFTWKFFPTDLASYFHLLRKESGSGSLDLCLSSSWRGTGHHEFVIGKSAWGRKFPATRFAFGFAATTHMLHFVVLDQSLFPRVRLPAEPTLIADDSKMVPSVMEVVGLPPPELFLAEVALKLEAVC